MNIKKTILALSVLASYAFGMDNVELTEDAKVFMKCIKDTGYFEQGQPDDLQWLCMRTLLPKYMQECGVSPFSRPEHMSLQQDTCMQLKYTILGADIKRAMDKGYQIKQ